MENRIIDAVKMARRIIVSCLGLKENEEILIVIDPETDMTMPRALAGAALECGAEYTIALMPSRSGSLKATTCPEVIVKAAESADVYIGLTRSSGASVYDSRIFDLVHQGGLRLCSMVMRDLDNFIKGGALADYEQLDSEGRALAAFWTERKIVEISSASGTHLRAKLGDYDPLVECGIAREPGTHMAFSDGEVSQAPNQGSMTGTLVIDGPICQQGLPRSPLTMEVQDGKVLSVKGEDRSLVTELNRVITKIPFGSNIAEIGIGLNPESLFNGDFEEEKKARGTCHIALGDNLAFGGSVKCDVHMDMIMYKPTILMDGISVVQDGKIIYRGQD